MQDLIWSLPGAFGIIVGVSVMVYCYRRVDKEDKPKRDTREHATLSDLYVYTDAEGVETYYQRLPTVHAGTLKGKSPAIVAYRRVIAGYLVGPIFVREEQDFNKRLLPLFKRNTEWKKFKPSNTATGQE